MREVIGWLIILACFSPVIAFLWNGFMADREQKAIALYLARKDRESGT